MSAAYSLERHALPPPAVRLVLASSLSDAEQAGLIAALTAAIADAPTTVLISLSSLPAYDPRLRALLLAIQGAITAHQGRAVYVADRPRLRGLALWVVHMAEDRQAKIVPNEAAAIEWLRISDPRVDAAQARTLQALRTIAGEGGAR